MQAIKDTFTQWATPATVILKDWRLGLLFWTLRLGVLAYVIGTIFVMQNWHIQEIPDGYPTFWFETGSMRENVNSANKDYCGNPSYDYVFTEGTPSTSQENQYWNDLGIECLPLPYGTVVSVFAKAGFLTTYLKRSHTVAQDCTNTPTDVSPCDLALAPTMASGTRNISNVRITTNGKDRCTCATLQDYFAIGVEHMKLFVDHHFYTSDLMDRISGSSTMNRQDEVVKKVYTCFVKQGEQGVRRRIPENVLSLAPGSLDLKGCYAEHLPGESTFGLGIEEWLSLAGVALDERLVEEVVGGSRPGDPLPFRRIVGTRVHITFNYYGTYKDPGDKNPVLCVVNVKNIDTWSSLGSEITYSQYEPQTADLADGTCPGSDGCTQQEYYDDYRRGIRFEFFARGQVQKFDWNTLYNALIGGIVLLGTVDVIVSVVAFYLLGDQSTVYRNACREPHSYNKALAKFGTDVALACQAFKTWDQENEGEKPVIDQQELAAVFRGGGFTQEESNDFANMIMEETVGKKGGKQLTCEDLISLMASELVSVPILKKEAQKKRSTDAKDNQVVPVGDEEA